ncbi:class I SAM-dependent methyltransferase [Alkaliphilus hydrothermalis]|uniref:tRNA A58 N-methylase Trm61 n=1 Tax=Alkaliphilus hydrothermalis TaxID=1482730 RepID=A0ABS2NSV8_9FIRM|nr:class I SAM-dependent methyltransferase [Alkaliphilus hydrothermalis]MBM7615857.1 tRNA A58 N-methylase Trm61 [Alkaliphilus hydrothermalis]
MNIVKIGDLDNLKEETPTYVFNQLQERVKDIMELPDEVLSVLQNESKVILDIGPGEGVSSIALASICPKAKVIGIEMDRKHLVAAWPLCKRHLKLELFWGALYGTDSVKRVDRDISVPRLHESELPKISTLFTWTGMSRTDIYELMEE